MRLSVFAIAVMAASAVMLGGCTLPTRLDAVPVDSTVRATVPGMPGARYFIGSDPSAMIKDGIKSFRREEAYHAKTGRKGKLPPAVFLAISGGGDNGAFGAGLLIGWTEAGTRPDFKLVTGISTGALIAPFAFLGPAYDARLKKAYTNIKPEDIYKEKYLLTALFGDSMADSTPLWALVGRLIGQDMLNDIARESTKGRLLLVATTNLDARRPVIWNIGAIAESGHPNALHLIHSILIASASIPGAFPPVMIDVEADGKSYQEMHVDGGATAQVFVYPPSINIKKLSKQHGITRERKLYVIRNARIEVEGSSVVRQMINIAGRAIQSLIQTQGIGDLYRIYTNTKRDGVEYNLAYIPSEFKPRHEMEFDTAYMRKLFDFAYKRARRGYPWKKFPPGYSVGN